MGTRFRIIRDRSFWRLGPVQRYLEVRAARWHLCRSWVCARCSWLYSAYDVLANGDSDVKNLRHDTINRANAFSFQSFWFLIKIMCSNRYFPVCASRHSGIHFSPVFERLMGSGNSNLDKVDIWWVFCLACQCLLGGSCCCSDVPINHGAKGERERDVGLEAHVHVIIWCSWTWLSIPLSCTHARIKSPRCVDREFLVRTSARWKTGTMYQPSERGLHPWVQYLGLPWTAISTTVHRSGVDDPHGAGGYRWMYSRVPAQ